VQRSFRGGVEIAHGRRWSTHFHRRFAFVDALRGFAALSVVLYHAYEGSHITGLLAHLPAWVTYLLKQGGIGVAVFFVLSGFVISHSVASSRVTFPFVGRFMLRRSIRLEPPYWLAIVLAICFALLSARVLPGKEPPSYSAGQIAAHIFYLQEMLGYTEINFVFWTLCQEVQFYFVYVLLLALSRNDPAQPMQGRATAVTFAVAALISLLWPLEIFTEGPWRGSFLPLWHGFLLGSGAYWAWRHPAIAPYYLVYGAILLVAGAFHSDNFTTICGLTSLLLWAAAISGRIYSACSWPWIQMLGAISYSLYLTHNPITGAAFRVGYMVTGRSLILEAVWWSLATCACLVFAWGVWWLVERPSVRLARRVRLAPVKAEVAPSMGQGTRVAVIEAQDPPRTY
jgi:peptidoglycan/LPS O-acetylase OafA/YrhL